MKHLGTVLLLASLACQGGGAALVADAQTTAMVAATQAFGDVEAAIAIVCGLALQSRRCRC
jgi:hypothetical protein